MTATGQTPGAPRLLAPPPTNLSALPAQRVEGTGGQTPVRAHRTGWYVRALDGSTEALVRPAVDTLAALLLADALRRNGPGWTVAVRRYGTERAPYAA